MTVKGYLDNAITHKPGWFTQLVVAHTGIAFKQEITDIAVRYFVLEVFLIVQVVNG